MIQEKVELGPIHTWLPYAMKLKLGMYGDRIAEVEAEFGFLSRSIESSMLHADYRTAQLRFGRIDPENSLILDRLFSEAIEKCTQTEITDRVSWIREITSVLSELNGFLKYLARMADRLGLKFLSNVVLKHREVLLDLIELLTGSRYGYYYLIPGGARYELTEGFQERIEKWVHGFQSDFDRIQSIFLWTHSFQNRLQSLGRVADSGDYGFVSEASVETTRYGLISHVESRLVYALNQCKSLSFDLGELVVERHEGDHKTPLGTARSTDWVRLKTPTGRGDWGLGLQLDSNLVVSKIEIQTPSQNIQNAIQPALEGESLEDVAVILQSLNFSVPEIDR